MLQPIVQERAASSSSADVEVFSVEVVSKGTDLSKISKIADSLNSLGGTRSEDSPAASIWFTAAPCARKGDTVSVKPLQGAGSARTAGRQHAAPAASSTSSGHAAAASGAAPL